MRTGAGKRTGRGSRQIVTERDYPEVISAQGLQGCVIDECGKPLVGRGRCRNHYAQWWKRTKGKERSPALNLKTKTPEERFWEDVEVGPPSECWSWTGATHRSGHGIFFISPERGRMSAHTFSIELDTGERCPPGKEGCHHCDNPPCCNPAHLYYGTRLENVQDSIRRDRNSRGERHRDAILTERAVLEIRVRFAAGETQPALASTYGIGEGHLSAIVNGHMWKHVGGPIKTHNRPGRRPNRKEAA